MSSSSGTPSFLLYDGAVYLTGTTFVVGVTWGLMTALYVVCMHSLIRNLRSPKASRKTAMLTAWITILWILSSLSSIANVYCTLDAFTWQWNYPGGPFTYLADHWNQPVPKLAYTTYLLAMWFADALMVSLNSSWAYHLTKVW
ncbi:hypothetical protein JVU11DRAFT_2195 [Chiua virens]|nr:hypothetical protein JVU11DRAFT_2195 [Chiua virens]